MKKVTTILVVVMIIFTVELFPQQVKKQDLRILYVGGSTDLDTYVENPYTNEKEKEDDITRRMTSFEQMLNRYFTSVKVINAKDYRQILSSEFDVTILDGIPPALSERQVVYEGSGKFLDMIPASYLNEDFDSPMLVIAEMGDILGRSIGLKHDWYCLCVDAFALNLNKMHDIFNKPYPVNLTIEERNTPQEAFHYQYFFEYPIPQTMPMWRVQTKGFRTDKGFRIGMASRPWGFADSPDAEFISGGHSMKTLDAPTIARHGNFLHWGFSASPEFMTEEARTVLANAICYISKFKGKGIISKKYNDRRATREYLKELKYYATQKAYNERLENLNKFDEEKLKEKKQAEEKKSKGEKLSRLEQMVLNYQLQPRPTFEEFLKRNHKKELFEKFGLDTDAYLKYYDENKNYFYGDDGSYTFFIDEEVKSLKIPNNDIRLLDKCIKMLEQNEDVEKALSILNRYTLVKFDKPQQWRDWFDKNKNQLFFTESGGFKFLINSYDKYVVGNQYPPIKNSDLVINSHFHPETDVKNPVAVSAYSIDKSNSIKELVLKMKINDGFHVYANLPQGTPFLKTEVNIKLPSGYEKVNELSSPAEAFYGTDGITIYTGDITFRQEIKGSGTGEAVFILSWQSCDDKVCYPPVREKEIIVKLY